MKKFLDLLDESSLACFLFLGLSIAAAVVFGLVAVVTGIAALVGSVYWAFAFILCGLLAGLAGGLAGYVLQEYY